MFVLKFLLYVAVWTFIITLFAYKQNFWRLSTVKPFNLAALKVGEFAFKIILATFILAN